MNTNSLQHRIVQKQHQSSWTDDPFELKGTFKGLKSVNHKRNLTDYAEELVLQYAKHDCDDYVLHLSDLPEHEQNELARLFLESSDRDTGECVHGDDLSIDSSYTCALLEMLKNDSTETREAFAEITRKNIVTYYTESLQEIIDNACSYCFQNEMNEIGYSSHTNDDNGDVFWSKC